MTTTTELCMHELDPATCSVCKHAKSTPVFVSGRGKKYHADRDCPTFVAERSAMEKRAGTVAPVTAARPGSRAVEGGSACATCT